MPIDQKISFYIWAKLHIMKINFDLLIDAASVSWGGDTQTYEILRFYLATQVCNNLKRNWKELLRSLHILIDCILRVYFSGTLQMDSPCFDFDDEFKFINFEESLSLMDCRHAAHCCIYSPHSFPTVDTYKSKAYISVGIHRSEFRYSLIT